MNNTNKKRLTIEDIASLCGVGKSTVSRVINQERNVNEVTRQKVLNVIKRHHFTPSKQARAMRGQHSSTIGIIVTRLDSNAENQAVSAMLPIFYAHNIDPIILESQFSPQKVDEHLELLSQREIDGVILFAFTGIMPEQLIHWKNNMVVIARAFDGYASVCHDDAGAVKTLMDYFHHQKKYNQIGFIGINLDDETTGLFRYQAYIDYCNNNEIKCNALLGDLNYQSGYQLVKGIIKNKPQAILCATDSLAFGVQKYLKEKNIKNIEVACIGRNDLLSFLFPETKTIRLGFHESGIKSANLLINMINKNEKPQKFFISPFHSE